MFATPPLSHLHALHSDLLDQLCEHARIALYRCPRLILAGHGWKLFTKSPRQRACSGAAAGGEALLRLAFAVLAADARVCGRLRGSKRKHDLLVSTIKATLTNDRERTPDHKTGCLVLYGWVKL